MQPKVKETALLTLRDSKRDCSLGFSFRQFLSTRETMSSTLFHVRSHAGGALHIAGEIVRDKVGSLRHYEQNF
jgi:hypothetical protein